MLMHGQGLRQEYPWSVTALNGTGLNLSLQSCLRGRDAERSSTIQDGLSPDDAQQDGSTCAVHSDGSMMITDTGRDDGIEAGGTPIQVLTASGILRSDSSQYLPISFIVNSERLRETGETLYTQDFIVRVQLDEPFEQVLTIKVAVASETVASECTYLEENATIAPPPPPSELGDGCVCGGSCVLPGGASAIADGHCDDGGPGNEYSACYLGTDCEDCGPRAGNESFFNQRLGNATVDAELCMRDSQCKDHASIEKYLIDQQVAECIPDAEARSYLCGKEYGEGDCERIGLEKHSLCRTTQAIDWVPSIHSYGQTPVEQCARSVQVSSGHVPNRALQISRSGCGAQQ
eukprot:4551447-Prymnesium_polylepis.1